MSKTEYGVIVELPPICDGCGVTFSDEIERHESFINLCWHCGEVELMEQADESEDEGA